MPRIFPSSGSILLSKRDAAPYNDAYEVVYLGLRISNTSTGDIRASEPKGILTSAIFVVDARTGCTGGWSNNLRLFNPIAL